MKLPMLTRFAYIIHSITPSQNEYERDFSLVGIYTASLRENLSVEMLSDLLFINRNIPALVRNGLVPAQDGLFALIFWYVAKSVFRS